MPGEIEASQARDGELCCKVGRCHMVTVFFVLYVVLSLKC